MFKHDFPQKSPLFEYFAPLGNHYRGVLSIPHSGETIPAEFNPYLSGDLGAYQEDVDFKVHELVDIRRLQEAGVAVVVAQIHRICVDLNRSENQCVLFWKENTHGKSLVVRTPDERTVRRFIETYHWPYFEILKASIQDLEKRKKAQVSMIDLHSMPSKPTPYHLRQNPNQELIRADFCLSDRRGKTCSPEFIQYFEKQLQAHRYSTAINDPYLGGFVTEFVDRFRTNNIQIEINRSVYMDEKTKRLIPQKVERLKATLTECLIQGFERFDS
jgi:N-formylglutamate amidohydrolase